MISCLVDTLDYDEVFLGRDNLLSPSPPQLDVILDEFAAYPYPLSTSQVNAHYLAGLNGSSLFPPPSPIVVPPSPLTVSPSVFSPSKPPAVPSPAKISPSGASPSLK